MKNHKKNKMFLFLLLISVFFGLILSSSNAFSTVMKPNFSSNNSFGENQKKELIFSSPNGFFIENKGQIKNDQILFYSINGNFFFVENGLFIKLSEVYSSKIYDEGLLLSEYNLDKSENNELFERGIFLKYTFVRSNKISPIGKQPCPWYSNFFYGNDPDQWKTEVDNYYEIHYPGIWDGIDLIYYMNDNEIKYDLVIDPGADPKNINIQIQGQDSVSINKLDELVIRAGNFIIKDTGLNAYYSNNINEEISCHFQLMKNDIFTFNLNDYDPNRQIIVDPILSYSTFIGGWQDDEAYDIEIDSKGNIFIIGYTLSMTFPSTSGAYDTNHNGGKDVFIAKLNSEGSDLIYSTYLGGSKDDVGIDLKIDSTGNVYLTGKTYDDITDYPTTLGAYDTSHNGYYDVFITKLNSAGSSLMYSTLIGGSKDDIGYGISIDTDGNAYITGYTVNATQNYPVTSGAYDTIQNGWRDVFVTKINPDGSDLIFSTLIGGSSDEIAEDILIDSTRNVYLTGSTLNSSINYPTTINAYNTIHNGGEDVFITKLNSEGSDLIFSSLIGSSEEDTASSIVLDSNDNIIITGKTSDAIIDLPTTIGAFDQTHNGGSDIFILKLNPNCTELIFSTFIGGSGQDGSQGIVLDQNDNPIITGFSMESDIQFPTTIGAYDTTYNGYSDVIIAKLSSNGSTLLYSSYIGGSYFDYSYGITIDSNDDVFITGETHDHTTDYPTTVGSYNVAHNGEYDAFISKFILDQTKPVFIDRSNNESTTGDPFNFTIEVTDTYPGIDKVYIEYCYGTGPETNQSMNGAHPYYFNIIIPDNSVDPIHYLFHAKDKANNWNHTVLKTVIVIDNDLPVFGNDFTPGSVGTGEVVQFSIEVTDNVDLSGIFVEYRYGSGPTTNESMVGSSPFTCNTIAPTDSLDGLNYSFHAVDGYGNWASLVNQMIIVDIIEPIAILGNDIIVNEDESILLNGSSSSDNIGIVSWAWSFNDGIENVNDFGPEIHHTFVMPGEFIIILNVSDEAGNWDCDIINITVLDNTDPIAIAGFDGIINEDTLIIFYGSRSTDNVGIINWTWSFIDNTKVVNLYSENSQYIFFEPGVYNISYTVRDLAGHSSSTEFFVTVLDITLPFPEAGINIAVWEGTFVVFNGTNSTDNVGIANWTWYFNENGIIITLYGETVKYNFTLPGNYSITLIVKDDAGNTALDNIIVSVKKIPITDDDDVDDDTNHSSIVDYWWVLLIILLVIILIIVTILLLKGRREKASYNNIPSGNEAPFIPPIPHEPIPANEPVLQVTENLSPIESLSEEHIKVQESAIKKIENINERK